MKFFHVYNEEYFEGLVKNNLINEDTGLKIQSCFAIPIHKRFNTYAAKGSPLHDLLKQNKFPFYVDRIAGGIRWWPYSFDKDLIKEYKDMLGEWFLGFQQHETGGNRALEWHETVTRMDGEKGPYADPTKLIERSRNPYGTTPEGIVLSHFRHASPEEYAVMSYPETVKELYDDYRYLFQQRMDLVDGMVLPCDGGDMLTKIQDDLGIQNFMAEVGGGIPGMRIATALLRGLALAKNKKWGMYYECWRKVQGIGYTMPCYNNEPGNEWYLTQQTHLDDFTSYGPTGGSSRLLQNRIYYYSLMSGADFMSEEWGLNCSYNDMNTFELSAYGQAKKDLIDFARNHRHVKAKIPYAFVLPKDYPYVSLVVLDWPKIGDWKEGIYFGRKYTEQEYKQNGRIEDAFKMFYRRADEDIYGNEGVALQNTRFGDFFDIIYEDTPEEAFGKYEALVDLTDDERFTARFGNKYPIISGADPYALGEQIEHMAKKTMPVWADCCHWLVSTDENGRYVSVFNNEGNERDLDKGDIVHHEADKVVMLTFKEASARPRVIKAISGGVKLEKAGDGRYALTVPAAEFAIIQY